MYRRKTWPLLSIWRRYARRKEGAVTVEFALIAGALVLLIVGILELGIIMLINSSLEGSARYAARYGITGQASTISVEERESRIRETAARMLPNFLDTDQLDLHMLNYREFDHIGEAEPFEDANGNGSYDSGETFTDLNGNGTWDKDAGLEGAGESGSIVVYELRYPWSVVTPLFGQFFSDGKLDLSARIVVKNEPYDVQDR
ncbi:TadE/TadG family type IV pilus assembly protein [Fodinicurvata fenggangensis]|uniref:TadE/TadG family type IV pilus assembly protein n=1 Tax=Fodinicurvata fenggangensis TaxID=1121830 RepID=UPI00055038DA|nr:TadE/TadG family type IV pilus assembly protein [Fodinicurvata fenggangensis]